MFHQERLNSSQSIVIDDRFELSATGGYYNLKMALCSCRVCIFSATNFTILVLPKKYLFFTVPLSTWFLGLSIQELNRIMEV